MTDVASKRCVSEEGVPRFDLDCLCDTPLNALPDYDPKNPEVDRLYDACLDDLNARARTMITNTTRELESRASAPAPSTQAHASCS